KDGKEKKLEPALRHTGIHPGHVAAVHQTHQAKCPLQGVLEIVLARVDGLIIVEAAAKALAGPGEGPRHISSVAPWKHTGGDRLHLGFALLRHSCVNGCEHELNCRCFYGIRNDLTSRRSARRFHGRRIASVRSLFSPALYGCAAEVCPVVVLLLGSIRYE